MRLYKMELYKLCHRKLVMIGAIGVIGILLLFFCLKVAEERAYVDGTLYEGYQAVQVNRQITEEFKGVLTDEKVEKLVAKYGFPQEVEDYYYYGFKDGNFLSEFVVNYISDGYFKYWDDYKIATCVYPLEATELGEAKRLTGREIILEYNNGWFVFLDVLQVGQLLGSVLALFCVSITFSGECRSNMLQLLFTTKDGRKKDIWIKIAAAFTIAGIIWIGIVVLDLLMCGAVFGFDGLDCFIGVTRAMNFYAVDWSASLMSVGHFTTAALLYGFVGMVQLCAVVLYISACFKSSFHAITVSAVYFGCPILIWLLMTKVSARSFFIRMIRTLQYASPLYMTMYSSMVDIYHMRHVLNGIAALVGVLCIVGAYWRYKGRQVQ